MTENDAHGLDLFDETASAVRGFPNAMLGYDKKAVDDYIRDIERQLSLAKHQLRSVQRELTAANLRVDDTDFSKLGAHTANLLKVAEAQAGEMIQSAQIRAETMLSEAHAEADRTRADAAQTAESARQEGLASIKGLRAELETQTARELAAVRAEAEGLRRSSDEHASTIVAEAERRAAALADNARREAEALRATAETQITALQAKAATDHEEQLRLLHEEQAALSEQLVAAATEARKQSDAVQEALIEASENLRTRQQTAYHEAEDVKAAAISEAAAIVATARAKAETILAQADHDLAARNEKLKREQRQLRQRKNALLSQLTQLSSLAMQTTDQFPEEEPTGPIEGWDESFAAANAHAETGAASSSDSEERDES